MNILVTGGAGFIGRHLVKALISDGHKITIFDNFSNSSKDEILEENFKNVKVIEGDIRSEKDISKSVYKNDLVIHLAAKISVIESQIDPEKTFEVNVTGTENVLKACVKNNIRKLIAISSAAVYEDLKKSDHICLESDNTKPISPYGESKLEMEKRIKEFSENNNINTTVLRLFNVFGKGQSNEYAGVISKFVKNIKNNSNIIIFGDGNQSRDFVAIEDIIDLICQMSKLEFKEKFDIFNVGSGIQTKIIELANLLIKISNKKINIVFKEKRQEEILHSVSSIEKAKLKLKYTPKINLEDGIKKFLTD
jgi:UDP-glucose 4-epimerase